MKLPPILTGIVLDPAAGTLDFSALGTGFDPRTVLGVVHEPSNRFIFAKGRPGLGYASIAGSVMTLALDTSDLAAGSVTGFRDDGALIATDARLEACRALLSTANATLANLSTALGTPADVAAGSDTAAGSLIAKITRLLATQTGIGVVLAAIRDRLPTALGPGTAATALRVTLPADGQFALSVGLPADASAASDTDPASIIAFGKRALGNWTALLARVPALVSGRVPVDGSGATQPISAAALPLPAGAATSAKQDDAIVAARGSIVTADTSGTLAAGAAATPVAANLTRQFVEITNTGANPLTYRWGDVASATVGHILGAGMSVRYDRRAPTAALNLFSTAGTTFFVTAG